MADKPSFYSILTADVRYDERLRFFARVLYSDITAMCNVKGYCSAGNEHFADKFKQSKRTVSGTIARLAELGYLRVEVIRDDGKTVVERRIWVQANAQEAMEKVTDPIEENFHTYRKKLPDPIEENFQDIKENNTRDNNNPLTPTGESELFDEFWAAYPKHVAKKPARRAWDKLHADRDLLDALLTALEWQTRTEAWQRDGGRYVPNPATWLNGRRWEDEPQAEAEPDKPPRRREEVEVW